MYRFFSGDLAHLLPILPSFKQSSTHLVDRNTVLGNVAGLATVVASLGHLVGGKSALLGDVATLTAGVALDSASLAVLGEVVWATALVAHSALGAAKLTASSWSWSRRCTALVLWALSRDVAKLRAVVALRALSAVWTVALDVADVSTQVALLGGGGLWLWTSGRLVAGLATVVAQSLSLLTVVGDVAGFTALVTGSWEHFW